MSANPTVSSRIRSHRRQAGWSQAELSRRSGVGLYTIAKIEQGEIKDPRISTVSKLATALGIDISALAPDVTVPVEP